MFSFGDALVIGFVLIFIVWLLKKLWPRVFGDFAELREVSRTSEGLSHVNDDGTLRGSDE